jgi:hypothetical protein
VAFEAFAMSLCPSSLDIGLFRYGKGMIDIDAGYPSNRLINMPEKGHDIKASSRA